MRSAGWRSYDGWSPHRGTRPCSLIPRRRGPNPRWDPSLFSKRGRRCLSGFPAASWQSSSSPQTQTRVTSPRSGRGAMHNICSNKTYLSVSARPSSRPLRVRPLCRQTPRPNTLVPALFFRSVCTGRLKCPPGGFPGNQPYAHTFTVCNPVFFFFFFSPLLGSVPLQRCLSCLTPFKFMYFHLQVCVAVFAYALWVVVVLFSVCCMARSLNHTRSI